MDQLISTSATLELPYGVNSRLRLDLPEEALVAHCAAPHAACDDPAAAVAAALDSPIDSPPLWQAVVPGDRIVLALDASMPQPAGIVAAMVQYLEQHGIAQGDVTILHQPGGSTPPGDLLSGLSSDAARPKLLAHNPDDRGQLAYLAADDAGEPIYLNRALCDADVAIPIGALRAAHTHAAANPNRALYPAFADTRTQRRFADAHRRTPHSRTNPAMPEPDVVWMLGLLYSVQVLPGAGGTILQVLAGQPQAVLEAGNLACAKAWCFPVPRRANLVVAALEGDRTQQTWENFGRALSAATDVVTEGGSIAILCDLEAPPGPAIERLSQSDDRESALRRIRKEHLPDAQIAAQLARAQEQARVYLLSRLDGELLEQLSIAPVSEAAEIVRLSRRHASCIVLSNAQHSIAVPGED